MSSSTEDPDAGARRSSCGHPPLAVVEAKLLLHPSSLMTAPMLGNCIPKAPSIGVILLESPFSAVFSTPPRQSVVSRLLSASDT
jgi:hypothetical protein